MINGYAPSCGREEQTLPLPAATVRLSGTGSAKPGARPYQRDDPPERAVAPRPPLADRCVSGTGRPVAREGLGPLPGRKHSGAAGCENRWAPVE